MILDVEHQFEKAAVSGRGILTVLAGGMVRISTLELSKKIRVSRVNKALYRQSSLDTLAALPGS